MSVAICIPSTDQVQVGFARCLANLTASLASQGIQFDIVMSLGSVLPQQRTEIVQKVLQKDYEWLLWLDSDMHFPDHTFNTLSSHFKDVVAATYSTRRKPQRSVAFKDLEKVDERVAKGTGLQPVDAVGMGCMLVHRSVYNKVEEPWFSHLWNPDTKTFSGEDIYFCDKAIKQDVEIYVDLDLSREVAHYGTKAYLLQETQDFL